MPLDATVLIPTHDHGPTLRYSVASAQAQTVEDLEIFIVGDGVPDVTREIVAELQRDDERVRFFDNPKGERHGELHRHAALQEAGGEIVCYLADDDLWMPRHVETMLRLLRGADFAGAALAYVERGGAIGRANANLADSRYRKRMLDNENRVPLSAGAHTMDIYKALPHGWRTTPPTRHTDYYMWQQILSETDARAVSGLVPTALLFPTPWRIDMTIDERERELAEWWSVLRDPARHQRMLEQIIAFDAKQGSDFEIHIADLLEQRDKLETAIEAQQREIEAVREAGDVRATGLEQSLAEADRRATSLERELNALRSSATWRLRERLRQSPLLRRPLQSIARWLAGRRGN